MPQTTEEIDFIATAKKRFKQAAEDEHDIRLEAIKDLEFVAGDQWDSQLKADRHAAQRPVLTFNRLPTFVQLIANEARQNKAQIKFSPSDDEAHKDTAEVFEGLARYIQYASDAGIAYETALEYAVACSFGYFRFLTSYIDDDSFDQELKIVPVVDPLSIYGVLIPSIFNRPAPWAFVVEDLPKEEFKNLYPKSAAATSGWESDMGEWATGDSVRVAEYWQVEESDKVIYRDGKDREDEAEDGTVPEDDKRTVKVQKVTFCKMTGMEVLPGTTTTWLGSSIPIIPVLGRQLVVKGKPKLFSLVRFQRDPQRMINMAKTRIAEIFGTAPVSPFIGAVGAFAGRETQWKTLNTQLTPYLEYNIQDVNGKPIPPPARQTFEPPIQSLAEFTAQEVDDLKAISGIFDQSLGEGTNDQSGTAIGKRQKQSNATNLHFNDNLERGYKKGAVVIEELIPPIYGFGKRTIKILGPDDTPKIVKVNQEFKDKGQTFTHDLSKGKYEMIVTVAKSFSAKKQETFDMLSGVIGGNPQLILWFGDIFFKNSDTAGADQMAERAKRMLNIMHPGLVEDDDQQPIPPQAQAQIAKGQQELQAMHAYAQQQEQEVQKLTLEKQAHIVEGNYKLMLADKDRLTKVAIAEIYAKTQDESERKQYEHEVWKISHQSAHDAATQAVDHAHEATQATQAQGAAALGQQSDQQAASESQASDQSHQAGMAEQAQQAAQDQPDGAA